MGYWYHDCYIDGLTLAEQKAQESECDKQSPQRVERVKQQAIVTESELPADDIKNRKWSRRYEQYLWRTSPVNLTPDQRTDLEFLKRSYKQRKRSARIRAAKKERFEKEWAWAWGKSYVYFILDPDRNLIKIGVSSELPNRFKRLQVEYPNIELKGVVPGVYQDEQDYHKILDSFRVDGEWFEPSPPVLHCIKHFTHTVQPSKALHGNTNLGSKSTAMSQQKLFE